MARRFTQQFKEDAVAYVQDHPELSIVKCAENLGISDNTLHTWIRKYRERGEVHRGSGNHRSEEAKENARLRRENQDLQDALNILKKAISILND